MLRLDFPVAGLFLADEHEFGNICDKDGTIIAVFMKLAHYCLVDFADGVLFGVLSRLTFLDFFSKTFLTLTSVGCAFFYSDA